MRGTNTTFIAGQNAVDDTPYSQAVVADGASHYWRLDEGTGATASTDWVGGNDLVLGSGVTNGAAGAVNDSTDTAATFDGTANGTAGATSAETGQGHLHARRPGSRPPAPAAARSSASVTVSSVPAAATTATSTWTTRAI